MITNNFYSVFIDDTGSPGNPNNSYLPSDRKTWVGIIIPPGEFVNTEKSFYSIYRFLNDNFKISELHFTDILGGRNEFKNIKWDIRIKLIELVVKIIVDSNAKIICQSMEPNQIQEWKQAFEIPNTLSIFNTTNTNEMALLLLIMRIKLFISKDSKGGETAFAFIDEGWKKRGVCVSDKRIFSPEFEDSTIISANSKDVLLLQLADFAAFTLNKMQIIIGKEKINKKELEFIKLAQIITPHYLDLVPFGLKIDNSTYQVFRSSEFNNL